MRTIRITLLGLLLLPVLSAYAQVEPVTPKSESARYSFGVQGHGGMLFLIWFPTMAPSWNINAGAIRQGDGRWDMELHAGITYLENGFSFSDSGSAKKSLLLDIPFVWRRWSRADRTGWFRSIGVQLSLVLKGWETYYSSGRSLDHEVAWSPSSFQRGRNSTHHRESFLVPVRLAIPLQIGYRFRQVPLELGGSLAINVSPYDVSMNPAIVLFPSAMVSYWF